MEGGHTQYHCFSSLRLTSAVSWSVSTSSRQYHNHYSGYCKQGGNMVFFYICRGGGGGGGVIVLVMVPNTNMGESMYSIILNILSGWN